MRVSHAGCVDTSSLPVMLVVLRPAEAAHSSMIPPVLIATTKACLGSDRVFRPQRALLGQPDTVRTGQDQPLTASSQFRGCSVKAVLASAGDAALDMVGRSTYPYGSDPEDPAPDSFGLATYGPAAARRRITGASASCAAHSESPSAKQPVHSVAEPSCSSTAVPASGPVTPANPHASPKPPM